MTLKANKPLNSIASHLIEDGYAAIPDLLDGLTVACLTGMVEALAPKGSGTNTGPYGIRNLLSTVPAVRDLATSAPVMDLVRPLLGPEAFPVRGLFFDKVPEANWKVPYHQDLTIAVGARVETEGFGPWSVKDGVPHTQAPAWLLERMLAVRLHLDDCGEEDGPLRVLPGTHRLGRLDSATIDELRSSITECTVTVPAGGAVLMKPLLLHASSPARRPSHRRVIHLEYAAEALPSGLRWYEA
jgi:hypothetical protein